METHNQQEIIIQGKTLDGAIFRPSDWAERLAGVMSQFRPEEQRHIDGHISYSPWCVPTRIKGVKCVILHADLKQHFPKAWDYALGFAKDNQLQVISSSEIDQT